MLRNILVLIGGMVALAFALTFGLFIIVLLGIIGLGFVAYFKLRGKEIINPVDQMGMGREPDNHDSQTIDAEYEVVEEEEKRLD